MILPLQESLWDVVAGVVVDVDVVEAAKCILALLIFCSMSMLTYMYGWRDLLLVFQRKRDQSHATIYSGSLKSEHVILLHHMGHYSFTSVPPKQVGTIMVTFASA